MFIGALDFFAFLIVIFAGFEIFGASLSLKTQTTIMVITYILLFFLGMGIEIRGREYYVFGVKYEKSLGEQWLNIVVIGIISLCGFLATYFVSYFFV